MAPAALTSAAGPHELELPAPALVDDGLGICLRPWGEGRDDVAALVAAWHEPALRAAGGVPAGRSKDYAQNWVTGERARRSRGEALDLVVAPLDDPSLVWGEVGLRNIDPVARRAEIGWWTAVDQRGRGIASAAVDLLAGWALRPPLALIQVWARIGPANVASARVGDRAGFMRLGRASDGNDVWSRAATVAP